MSPRTRWRPPRRWTWSGWRPARPFPGGTVGRRAAARRHRPRHRQAPDLLLCDEPTGALDSKTGVQVLEVLKEINDSLGTSTVVITHNAGIQAMAHRVILFADGKIAGVEVNETRVAPHEIAW
jgi:putative ABC transport system ATP-binding protein